MNGAVKKIEVQFPKDLLLFSKEKNKPDKSGFSIFKRFISLFIPKPNLSFKRAFLIDILKSTTDIICIINEKGIIKYINPAIERYGYKISSLEHQSIYNLMYPEDAEELKKLISCKNLDQRPLIKYSQLKNNKRKNVYLKQTWKCINKGNQKLYSGVFSDISEKRYYLNSLRNIKKSIKEAESLKSNFLSNISHEIRTPLNSILGFSSLISSDIYSSEEKKLYCHLINESSRLLLHNLDSVVEYSKIMSGCADLNIEKTDIKKLVKDINLIFVKRAKEKNVKIINQINNNDVICYIDIDKNKLKRILYCLLDNSLKYTENGFIKITYTITSESLNISVKDTGSGISEEDQKKIFKHFEKPMFFNNKSNPGTGLGLAITIEYLKLMKGEINFTSKWGEGTCFKISLPVNYAVKNMVTEEKPYKENIQNK